MRGCEPAAPRPRPLSGGLWTLLSWLRRDDHASSDSLSSAGSDRTAISFAFLHPPPANAGAALPPVAPTDSYRKRLRDRNLRRQHDRDLTLRRKYGLFREGGCDTFTLPAHRREGEESDQQERERRAASEGSARRAHVPGKRRAPPPPAATASLPRRPRKRPAPQPPVTSVTMHPRKPQKENTINDTKNVSPGSSSDVRPQSIGEYHYILDCKPEKYSKKGEGPKENKLRSEKSFIKQIFENKKRNSAIETKKFLPNISELDKQAAEIIESCKLKPLTQHTSFTSNNASTSNYNTTTWFCTMCLRKYDSSVVTCINCLPDKTRLSVKAFGISNIYTQTESGGSTSAVSKNKSNEISGDEKQKLKDMLKEMKDSLPKKQYGGNSKSANGRKNESDEKNNTSAIIEPTTLRIGFSLDKSNEKQEVALKQIVPELKTKKILTDESQNKPVLHTMAETVIVTQPVVLIAPLLSGNVSKKVLDINKTPLLSNAVSRYSENLKPDKDAKKINGIENYTPVKLSSLLNPAYIPKSNISKETLSSCSNNAKITHSEPIVNTKVLEKDVGVDFVKKNLKQDTASNTEGVKEINVNTAYASNKTNELKTSDLSVASYLPPSLANSSKLSECNMIRLSAAQHSERRELINQLEQSIAMGDERRAADAATKLAQLKLSCAVLSFSSQIAGETAGPSTKTVQGPVSEPSNTKFNDVSLNKSSKEKISFQSKEVIAVKPLSTEKKEVQAFKTELGKENNPTPVSVPSTSSQCEDNIMVTIEVWVEDREATRGPVRLQVPRRASLGELRRLSAQQLGLAARLQRWIVGRTLCHDDNTPLVKLAGPDFAEPFYLCLVEAETTGAPLTQIIVENISEISENAKSTSEENQVSLRDKTGDVYSELMQLEQRALVANVEPFQCVVCLEECGSGEGAVLRECVHTFCRECLAEMVKHSEEPAVACPAVGCAGALQEREIRALVSPEDYEKWLARGLAAAESGTRNAFHCRTRDCTGWALCDPGVLRFPCPVCMKTNCVPCEAIHEGKTCEQHRKEVQRAAATPDTIRTDEGTRALLDTLINKGEALECPECSAIITKKWGCDWVKCSACKTEICWVTRGRRWGPAGRGDTSAGCRCGLDGKRCHPSCGYCH